MNGPTKRADIKIVLGCISGEHTKLNERVLWQTSSCSRSSMLPNGFSALSPKACTKNRKGKDNERVLEEDDKTGCSYCSSKYDKRT